MLNKTDVMGYAVLINNCLSLSIMTCIILSSPPKTSLLMILYPPRQTAINGTDNKVDMNHTAAIAVLWAFSSSDICSLAPHHQRTETGSTVTTYE